jgi:GT2 family glycosyltransferase
VLRLLRALRAQSVPSSAYEVVVAIDGSDDGTEAALRAFAAPYELRWLVNEHRGRAATKNAAAAAAHAKTLVILDDDMEPRKELLAGHLQRHEASTRIAVVGAAPIRLDASTPPFPKWWGTRFNDVLDEIARRADSLAFSDAYGGNFSIAASDFNEVGGFYEGFDRYGLEDYELALRLVDSGVDLVFASEALADQHYEKPFADAARDEEARGRSTVTFVTRHPSYRCLLALRDDAPPSGARRLFRFLMPRLTAALPILRNFVVRVVTIAERRGVRRLPFAYELALEYFFLVGLNRALAKKPT